MNLIIATVFLIIAIIFILCWYFVYYKRFNLNKKYTAKADGIVVDYVSRGGGDEIKFDFPKFEYVVNNVKYYVYGPNFRKIIYKHYNDTEDCNIKDIHHLPDTLKINVKGNIFYSNIADPLRNLYPKGTKCNIYYDLNNPKKAFVERWINPSKIWYLFILFSIVCLIFSILFGFNIISINVNNF